MSVETDRLVGTDLAGYRLESVLGRGGMGVVYLATDLRLERKVALKLVAPELAGDPRFRERFLRESRLAASLDHSHVVPVHAAGETDGQLWIAMRYVQGTDLGTLLDEEGPLEPARAVELCSQIGEALDAAHAHGLVHRDVKPANVLVTQEGGEDHCYLTDFGLARTADIEAGPGTGAHLSGTVDYTAPEQIAAETADQRADIYSLGCVLNECLAGEPPFKRPRPVATLFAHASEPPPSLHQHRPELPQAIDQVIGKALAKDPEERYETCGELTGAAKEALGLAEPRISRRRLLLLSVGGAVMLAAAAAVPAILFIREDETATPARILPLAGDSLVRIDPETNELAAAITTGDTPDSVAVGDGTVWVASQSGRILTQVSSDTNRVLETVDVTRAGPPVRIEVAGESVWSNHYPASSFATAAAVWRYDPETGSLLSVATGAHVWLLGVDEEDGVWITDCCPSRLARIDPVSGDIAARFPIPTSTTFSLHAIAEGILWTTENAPLARVDLTTGESETFGLDFYPNDISVGAGAVWLSDLVNDSVARFDIETSSVTATVRVGREPSNVAVGDRSVWVANRRDSTVTRIDPETLDVRTIDVGGIPTDIAVGEGAVWVTVDVR